MIQPPHQPTAPPGAAGPSLKSTFASLAARGPIGAKPKPGAPPMAGASKPAGMPSMAPRC